MAEPSKNPAAHKLPMSLYPELLQSERATISAAPVRYDAQQKSGDEEALQLQLQKKKKDASLQFQPLKRPQPAQQKKKPQPKSGFSSSSSLHKLSSSVNTASASSPPKSAVGSTPSIQRSTFQDWVADEDDEFYYQERARAQRGGKNRKKKNKAQEVRMWDWDDIYDPTRPNVFADYKGSEEQHREVRDWKARLYHRQLKEARKANKARSDDESSGSRPTNRMFAPPTQQMSFAPPTFDNPPPPPPMDSDDNDYYPPPSHGRRDSNPSTSPAPARLDSVSDDATGEDAYLQRMRMSGAVPNQPPPAQPSPPGAPLVAAPPSTTSSVTALPPALSKSQEALKAEALAKIAAIKAKFAKPAPKPDAEQVATHATAAASTASTTPPTPADTNEDEPPPPPLEPGVFINRAPVRYDAQKSASDLDDQNITMQSANSENANSSEQPQSNRPSKKGLGERLLKKYGWEKGQGLGAQGEGITTALVAKADKRKMRSDAEGGGWAAPANMGKIVGGKRRKVETNATSSNNETHSTNLSSVIKLQGMLAGLDVQKEIEDNNLMQEIGDEMGNNYGNVERVFIWREEQGGGNEVFVKFTSQLSALRAKDAMDGTTFADNEVQAAFWDEEMFERGEYGDE